MSLTFQEPKSTTRSRAFRPASLQLEPRLLLSRASILAIPSFATAEVRLAKSTALKLNGVSPYGFPFRGTPTVGDPIVSIGLGCHSQNLTANGVKVPNSPQNGVVPVEGNVVATVGKNDVLFDAPAILNLTTRKGNLTLDLNPVSPGSNKVDFTVASGTGVFAQVHGTGTITFGKVAKFHSNR